MTASPFRRGVTVICRCDADRTDRFCPRGTVTGVSGSTVRVRWHGKARITAHPASELMVRP